MLDKISRKEATNAIKSFFLWLDDLTVPYHVKFTEKVVVGKELGGTIDCGLDGFKDPNKVIFVDYKTSPNFYLAQFLQLAGYTMIYEEVNGTGSVEGVMIVLADKKHGDKARAKLITRKNLDSFISCFDCLFHVAIQTKMLESVYKKIGEDVT